MKSVAHLVLAALFLLLAAPASNAAPLLWDDVTFEAVDEVVANPNYTLTIAGVEEGETTVSEATRYVGPAAFEACHRAAMLAMELPGRYTLELRYVTATFTGCHLRRR